MKTQFLGLFLIVYLICSFNDAAAIENPKQINIEGVKYAKFDDGVEHYYHENKDDAIPWFFNKLSKLLKTDFLKNKGNPFGRSVAFLVGVRNYKYIDPDLPSVDNDLKEMTKTLLLYGGFDEIYVAQNDIVDRDLVEKYMKYEFTNSLNEEDRLLFYYTGHGDDNSGVTGYMLFKNARPNEFWGADVLSINDVKDWSREFKIRHMLFLFDCCASGLAFTSKSVDNYNDTEILETLSGNGSRVVLTAGTAEQKAYAYDKRNELGMGIFTSGFTDALKPGYIQKKSGMLSITDVYSYIEKKSSSFAAEYSKKLTPRLWTMQEYKYRGTFVFINYDSTISDLSEQEAVLLGVESAQKGKIIGDRGVLVLLSYVSGKLYIDDTYIDYIQKGELREYYDIPTGERTIKISGKSKTYTEKVTFRANFASQLTILPEITKLGLPSPLKKGRSSLPRGNLRFFSSDVDGKLYVDGEYMGMVRKGEDMFIKDLEIGIHVLTVVNDKKSVVYHEKVYPGKTTVQSDGRPSAPMNLRIVQ